MSCGLQSEMSTSIRKPPVYLFLCGACVLLLSGPMQAEAASEDETRPTGDRVILPDGATIELVGVSEYPTRPDSWWRADGTPLARPPIARLVCPPTSVADRLLRLFAFNVITDGQAEFDEPTGPKDECSTQDICTKIGKTESGRSLLQEHIVAAIRPAARIDLVVNYESGPWRTVATTDGHERKLAGLPFRPRVIWETTSTDRSVPEISAAHNIDLDTEHVWLIAVDNDNILHQPRQGSNIRSGHVQIRTARFPDVPINRVKEYRLATHLADRRFRFKLDANPPGAAPADNIVWGPSEEDPDAATITAACRIHMKKGRIIAVDNQGQEHLAKFGEYPSVGNFCLMTAVFPRLPLARVKEFRFQTRTFHHHIEFRNVSLHGGQKNPAQIWLDGKRYASKVEPKAPNPKTDSSARSANP
jgi:hypothetical protein